MTNFASRYANEALKNLCPKCSSRVVPIGRVVCEDCTATLHRKIHFFFERIPRKSTQERIMLRKRLKIWSTEQQKCWTSPKPLMADYFTYRTVYVLSASGWPFYVGSTVKSLEERLGGHIDTARSDRKVRKSSSASVIRALIARGVLSGLTIDPLVILPLTVSVRELRSVELECIRLLSDSGLHLFQIVGTKS